MTKKSILSRALASGAASLLLVACATGGGGGNVQMLSSVTVDIGVATSSDLNAQGNDVLRRRQFLVQQTMGPPAILIESEWRQRIPFEDEAAQGVTEAQSRIIIRGRERISPTSRALFQVSFRMESQVKTADSQEWIELPATEELRDWAREIARELQLALQGMRG